MGREEKAMKTSLERTRWRRIIAVSIVAVYWPAAAAAGAPGLAVLRREAMRAGSIRGSASAAQPCPLTERWFVVSLGGTPVGYVREASGGPGTGAGTVLVSDSLMKMVLNRLGAKVEIAVTTRTEEMLDGRLKKITSETRASVLSTKSEALIKDGLIEIRTEAGGKSYKRTVPYTGTLLGPEGIRRLSLERVLRPGDRIEFQTFSSETETVSRGSQTALAWENVRIGGGEVRALKVEEVLEGAGAKITSWLDDRRETLRQEMPTPFGVAEIVLATREQALQAEGGGALPEEMFERSILRTAVRLPQARTLEYLKVRLIPRDPVSAWPEFSGPSPKAVDRTGTTIDLEIRRPKTPGPARLPVAGTEANREFLEPNAYIQSDDPAVRKTALDVLGGETDIWKAGLKLERWVAENMQFDLGIVLAPSSELFKNRRGTCVGYATLLATLARAAGIPSRVVIGYVYALGMFGGHAWTEIAVGEAWIPLDSAIVAPGVADAARIGMSATSFRQGASSLVGGPARQLFGRTDIRILEFAGPDHKVVAIPPDAAPFTVDGDGYRNPWLGIALAKPEGWKFVKLDAVWPDPAVVGLEGPAGMKAELQEVYLPPWKIGQDAARLNLARVVPGGKERRARIAGHSAIIWENPDKSALAVLDGTEAWLLVVTGKDAPAVLTKLASGFNLMERPKAGEER
jgi:transglutaminase-like putative cysteine protease